jgi:hypothetical protein
LKFVKMATRLGLSLLTVQAAILSQRTSSLESE